MSTETVCRTVSTPSPEPSTSSSVVSSYTWGCSRYPRLIQGMRCVDERKIVMELDVSHSEHSHVIGKRARRIRRIMKKTGCSINFPIVLRNTYSNKVFIEGNIEEVERVRDFIRKTTPLSYSFTVPSYLDGDTINMRTASILARPDFKKVHVMYVNPGIVIVRGMEQNSYAVQTAARLLINSLCCDEDEMPKVRMTMMITPQYQRIVRGCNDEYASNIMRCTSTRITFAESEQFDCSWVNIVGDLQGVLAAKRMIIGATPISIKFEIDAVTKWSLHVMGLEELQNYAYGMFIEFERRTWNTYTCIVSAAERYINEIYETRRMILGFDEPIVEAILPQDYFIPERQLVSMAQPEPEQEPEQDPEEDPEQDAAPEPHHEVPAQIEEPNYTVPQPRNTVPEPNCVMPELEEISDHEEDSDVEGMPELEDTSDLEYVPGMEYMPLMALNTQYMMPQQSNTVPEVEEDLDLEEDSGLEMPELEDMPELEYRPELNFRSELVALKDEYRVPYQKKIVPQQSNTVPQPSDIAPQPSDITTQSAYEWMGQAVLVRAPHLTALKPEYITTATNFITVPLEHFMRRDDDCPSSVAREMDFDQQKVLYHIATKTTVPPYRSIIMYKVDLLRNLADLEERKAPGWEIKILQTLPF